MSEHQALIQRRLWRLLGDTSLPFAFAVADGAPLPQAFSACAQLALVKHSIPVPAMSKFP